MRSLFAMVAGVISCPSAFAHNALDQVIDSSIDRAVAFLVSKQREDGSWGKLERVAVTGLTIEAILAAGHKPGKKAPGIAIERGVRWLLTRQDAKTGLFKSDDGKLSSKYTMYVLGTATKALAAVCAYELPKGLKKECRRAVERSVTVILRAQKVRKAKKAMGGWRYSPTYRDSDLSHTSCQLAALFAARKAGVKIPRDAFEQAQQFVLRCFLRGRFGYRPSDGGRTGTTAIGITLLHSFGETKRDEYRQAVTNLIKANIVLPDLLYGLYNAPTLTEALFVIGPGEGQIAAQKLIRRLLKQQRKDGSWAARFARVYGAEFSTGRAITALAVQRRFRAAAKK